MAEEVHEVQVALEGDREVFAALGRVLEVQARPHRHGDVRDAVLHGAHGPVEAAREKGDE